MNIPVNQLLRKMNEHVNAASNESETKLREHLMAIRTLCDVILDLSHEEPKTVPQIQVVHPAVTKSTHLEDDANGDSIFDF